MEQRNLKHVYTKYRNFLIYFWAGFAMMNIVQQYITNNLIFKEMQLLTDYVPSLFRFALWLCFSVYTLRTILLEKKHIPEFDQRFYLTQAGYGILFFITSLLLEAGFTFVYLLTCDPMSRPLPEEFYKSIISSYLIRFNYCMLVYILITVFAYFIRTNFDKQMQELKEAQLSSELSELKLQFLNTQIKPHFIFNTQHAIISLIEQGDVKKSSAMLVKLSTLLRNVLNFSNRTSISLAEEIENIRNYIDIQKVRFGEGLLVNYSIAMPIHQIQIPPLLLQPIVENIFHHAFADLEEGIINISISEEDARTVISVKDNGMGFNEKNLNGSRIGLSNVRKRIENYFGSKATLLIDSIPNVGTDVRITITAY